METITIRVEGFDFEEFASQFMQLSKDTEVSIRINSSSDKGGGFAYDPTALIAVGINVLVPALSLLLTWYQNRSTNQAIEKAIDRKSKPTIVIYGADGWRHRWRLQEITFSKEEIEHMAALAREHHADRITVYAPLDEL